MHYKINEYTLIPYEYTKIEKEFFLEIKKIIDTFPLKIYDFFDIIHNYDVSYIRDSTLIISLFKLNKNEISNVFEILKRFLRIKAVTKIFYKKEFIIVHFYSEIISKFLIEKKSWMYIDYYFIIKEKITKHIYYQGILKINDIEEQIKMFFCYNKKYYIFSDNTNLHIDNSNFIFCKLETKNMNSNGKTINYFLANTLKEEQIYKLVFNE